MSTRTAHTITFTCDQPGCGLALAVPIYTRTTVPAVEHAITVAEAAGWHVCKVMGSPYVECPPHVHEGCTGKPPTSE